MSNTYKRSIEVLTTDSIGKGKTRPKKYVDLNWHDQRAIVDQMLQANDQLRELVMDIIDNDFAEEFSKQQKQIDARAESFGDLVTGLRNICNDARVSSINHLSGEKAAEFNNLYQSAYSK